MSIGENIKKRRKLLDMTLEQVAEYIGVSRQTMSRYETGVIGNIPSDKVEQISKFLRVSPAYLMGWEESSFDIPPGFIPLPETERLPLVGSIACGMPILAEQNINEYIDVPRALRADFCLRCEGDSMIDAGIHEGDIVYIKKQPTVDNGQIAAVRIDDVATLKRIYLYEDRILLQPENRNYAPIVYLRSEVDDLNIEGVAVGILHWM